MSYILDALRKAETERASHRVSCLVSSRRRGLYPRKIQARHLLYFGIVLVCTMALTWWWARHGIPGGGQAAIPSNPETNQVAELPVEPHNEVEQEEKFKSSHEPPEPTPKVLFGTPAPRQHNTVEVVQPVVNKPENTPIRKVADVSLRESHMPASWPVKKQPATETGKDLAASPRSPSSRTSEGRRDVVAMIAREVEQVRARAVDDSVSLQQEAEISTNKAPAEMRLVEEETPPPLLSTLPYRFQSILPDIVINAQAYAKEAQARFVIINMKKYREGERTEAGVMVEKIREEYLVLSYQGQLFRLDR